MEKGHFTRQEIYSQPESWAAALKVLDENRKILQDLKPAGKYRQIIFTGCGSTYYLALAAAALTQELTGAVCRAFPASELWLSAGSSYVDGRSLLVAVSRSGETTETLRACEAFLDAKRGELLTFSCYGEMPLAGMGSINIVLPSGQERSVAQTRAFSTLYLGTVAAACLWSEREELYAALPKLPERGERVFKSHAKLAGELGRDASPGSFLLAWFRAAPRPGV